MSDSAWSAEEVAAPSDWLTRDTLTGDWGGSRTWLQDHGIRLEPRLSQFYQGLSAGDVDSSHDYGGKADLRMTANLARLGAWDGLSMVIHAEYNFGTSANGRGGVMIPVNTALYTPGMDGADAFDISSFYFIRAFANKASLAFGKMNMIDMVAGKPFMGGAGIDSFWNHTFTATPTGTVPPYLFGVLASVPTDAATYRLWVYDLHSYTNRSVSDDPFADGVSIRGQVDFNVTIGGRRGHQGFSAFYSSQGGTDLETLGDTIIPSPTPGSPGIKESRYYVAYSFDQYLREAGGSSGEGYGLFGQARCLGWQSQRSALVDVPRRGWGRAASRPEQGPLGCRVLLRWLQSVPQGFARGHPDHPGRGGARGLLRLPAGTVVPRGRGPAGHQARPRRVDRSLSRAADGHQVVITGRKRC